MKEIFCNVQSPSMSKIAYVTGHKLSSIRKEGKVTTCKLDGVRMLTKDAKEKMLEGVILVTFGGGACRV